MGVVSISELMKMDRGLVKEVPTKEVYAKHLSKILGKRVTVKVKALPGNTYCSGQGFCWQEYDCHTHYCC